MRRFITTAAVAGAGVATYLLWARPRIVSWGTTWEERSGPLPGDEIVPAARYDATHAVGIDALPETVWPWVVQIGQGRGGLYSYDWLENLVGCDMHSLEEIDPDLQHLAVGDPVRLMPKDSDFPLQFDVAEVTPPSALVLKGAGTAEEAFAAGLPFPSWAFVLRREGDATRLVVRFRSDFAPSWQGQLANKYLLEPVHFGMERKMLLGIKRRAEATPSVATGEGR